MANTKLREMVDVQNRTQFNTNHDADLFEVVQGERYSSNDSLYRKTISCATIIVSQDKKYVLLGKIALQDKYDLPKGRMETDETYVETAIRELYEETDLVIPKNEYASFQDIDDSNVKVNRYTRDKDIVVFFVHDKQNKYINQRHLSELKSNTFIDNDNSIPELSHFRLFEIDRLLNDDEYAKEVLNYSMYKLFRRKFVRDGFKKILSD